MEISKEVRKIQRHNRIITRSIIPGNISSSVLVFTITSAWPVVQKTISLTLGYRLKFKA